MLIKTCRVKTWCLPYKFFIALLDVSTECVEFNDLFGSVFINRPGTVDVTILVKLLECWLIKPQLNFLAYNMTDAAHLEVKPTRCPSRHDVVPSGLCGVDAEQCQRLHRIEIRGFMSVLKNLNHGFPFMRLLQFGFIHDLVIEGKIIFERKKPAIGVLSLLK